MSNSYHNMTAHYNAYFIAREHIKEIEQTREKQYDWNYNLMLPIFPPVDSATATAFAPKIEGCVEKASLAIQHHKGSKWEDRAYLLVGKARFYAQDYQNAVETFKYVNTKGEGDDVKHEALVALMRTFIEYQEYNNARAVSDYLKKKRLSKKPKRPLSYPGIPLSKKWAIQKHGTKPCSGRSPDDQLQSKNTGQFYNQTSIPVPWF